MTKNPVLQSELSHVATISVRFEVLPGGQITALCDRHILPFRAPFKKCCTASTDVLAGGLILDSFHPIGGYFTKAISCMG